MSDERAQAFWSYVHADDDAEHGLIIGLAACLQEQYGLITGSQLEIFIDRDKIHWGTEWRVEVDRAVTGAGFFVPVITPRYFQSIECRHELENFQARAEEARSERLLLPIYYTSVPELEDPSLPANAAMNLIRDTQREDWREIRLLDPSWPQYRQAVCRMVNRIAAVVQDLIADSLTPRVAVSTDRVADDPTTVDDATDDSAMVADTAADLQRWQTTIGDLDPIVRAVAKLTARANAESEASADRGDGASGALRVAAKLAHDARADSERIATLGQEVASLVKRIDHTLTAIRGSARLGRPSSVKSTGLLADELAHRIAASQATRDQVACVVEQVEAFAKYALVLRPALSHIQRGDEGLADAEAIYRGWPSQPNL